MLVLQIALGVVIGGFALVFLVIWLNEVLGDWVTRKLMGR